MIAPELDEREPRWYLIRTKQHREQLVNELLRNTVLQTFLPLLRTRRVQWGKTVDAIVPLFPCYLFAYLTLSEHRFTVARTIGVVGLVCAGSQPCVVDEAIVRQIRERTKNGAVELSDDTYCALQPVQVVRGPLRGLAAAFERYMSGTDRVALILNAVGGASVRIILPQTPIASAF